jgi:hypothetical protein
MDAQIKRFDDAESVPVWSSEQGSVIAIAPSVLVGDSLICMVRNRIGRAQQASIDRSGIRFEDDRILDGEGREILAFLIAADDAAACIKAFPPRVDSGMSAVQKMTTNKQALIPTKTKPTVSTQIDPRTMLSRLEVKWFNCGRTASTIQEDLLELLGKELPAQRKEYRTDSFPAFLSTFSTSPDVPILIDVTVLGVNTFTIEMQSSNQYYLVQGYQGAYSAFWWQGLAERPQDLSLPAEASAKAVEEARARLQVTRQFRDLIGKGRSLDLDTLGTYLLVPLRTLMDKKVWNAAALEAWKSLPFFTNQAPDGFPRSTKVNIEDDEPTPPEIELLVSVVRLTRWAEIYESLRSARPASICGLLVARGLQQYEKYLKLAK